MNRRSTVGNKTRMKEMGFEPDPNQEAAMSFNDLDGVISSPMGEWKRPWWVREVDKPTMDIDWDATERFDARKIQQMAWKNYVGEDKAKRMTERRGEKIRQWMKDERPGYTLRDRALDIAGYQGGSVGSSFQGSWNKNGGAGEGAGEEISAAKLGGAIRG